MFGRKNEPAACYSPNHIREMYATDMGRNLLALAFGMGWSKEQLVGFLTYHPQQLSESPERWFERLIQALTN
jgi:hypothetical protein